MPFFRAAGVLETRAVPGREAEAARDTDLETAPEADPEAGVSLALSTSGVAVREEAGFCIDLRSVILIFLPLSAMRSFMDRKRVSTGGSRRPREELRSIATVVLRRLEAVEVAGVEVAVVAAAFLGGRPRFLGLVAGVPSLGGEQAPSSMASPLSSKASS